MSCKCVVYALSQIIHLKRFQFFNGRWVKSQRKVRFPVTNLDPLRFTVQNGNETRTKNDIQVQPTSSPTASSQSVSDKTDETQPISPDTRPEDNIEETSAASTLANGAGGEHPVINEGRPAKGVEVRRGSTSKQEQQLDETLHRREGNIYNLVAITVSIHKCTTSIIQQRHYL